MKLIWSRLFDPIWADENTGYVFFFIDSANAVSYRKTTDGGASWIR